MKETKTLIKEKKEKNSWKNKYKISKKNAYKTVINTKMKYSNKKRNFSNMNQNYNSKKISQIKQSNN